LAAPEQGRLVWLKLRSEDAFASRPRTTRRLRKVVGI
jgi:hypothetical protein